MSNELSNEALQILEYIYQGKNILLHAPGGCGKTFLIKQIAKELENDGMNVCCTATTGIAAVNLSSAGLATSTVHSWAGIGMGKDSKEKLFGQVSASKKHTLNWTACSLLIIDEISMMGASLFEKLDYIGKNIRDIFSNNDGDSDGDSSPPFGGLQLLVCGDFLQLAPVNDEWVFTSDAWSNIDWQIVTLETPKRYDDLEYFSMLKRIRFGKPSKKDIRFLESCVEKYEEWKENPSDDPLTIKPTVIYSKKVNVDHENKKQLDKLQGKQFTFNASDTFKPGNKWTTIDKYKKLLDDAIPEIIVLKIGAQVMLKVNIDVGAGLANGSRGVVTNIVGDSITVKFMNGQDTTLSLAKWEQKDKDGIATRSQIPLILAWSLTCHKCQGLTLDLAVCDIGKSVFCPGQAYVSLSRVKSRAGLFISEFLLKSIRADEQAIQYVSEIEESSEPIDRISNSLTSETLNKSSFLPMVGVNTRGIKYVFDF